MVMVLENVRSSQLCITTFHIISRYIKSVPEQLSCDIPDDSVLEPVEEFVLATAEETCYTTDLRSFDS